MCSNRNKKSGFTLIETMIVVSVMVIISTMLLSSTKSNQSQVALSTSQAVVAGILNRAKSMALAKWDPSKSTTLSACGFGVHFDVAGNALILYQDLPNFPPATPATNLCGTGHLYAYVSGEAVQTINLDPKVALDGVPADIVFNAPYLEVSTPLTITLKMKNDVTKTKSVGVTSGGSITSF
jgi:prepilin-type N-terminal cleavage/methylation domain-containing protein